MPQSRGPERRRRPPPTRAVALGDVERVDAHRSPIGAHPETGERLDVERRVRRRFRRQILTTQPLERRLARLARRAHDGRHGREKNSRTR
jgi:hypothetical protein